MQGYSRFVDFSGHRREKTFLVCPVLCFLEAGYIKPLTIYRRWIVFAVGLFIEVGPACPLYL